MTIQAQLLVMSGGAALEEVSKRVGLDGTSIHWTFFGVNGIGAER